MNIKKTIIIILLALVAMSADAQSLNKDVERLQYVYALKVVINDSVWSGFADKQYDVPLLYYGDTCCYVVNPTEKFLAKYPSVLIHCDNNIQIYQTEKVDDKPFHMHVTFTDEESNIDYHTPFMRCSSLEQTSKTIPDVTSVNEWATMVMHEYFHGFQFKNDGYLDTYEAITNAVLPDTLIALAACHDWYRESITQENNFLLKAIDTNDIEASRAYIQSFLELRNERRERVKKNLWVGDIQQLSPIVALNGDRIKISNYQPLINGLQLLADNSSSPIYQLTTTYRFGQRAASYTGIFYGNSLVAKDSKIFGNLPSLDKILNKEGGPSLVFTDMPPGSYTPQFAILLATFIVASIIKDDKIKEIAVLTCMRNTTRSLQKSMTQHIGSNDKLLVDTVARVQGLTTDITIFFVPNTSYIRTLEPHLFNVATSRAKEHTIIVADKNVLEYPTIRPLVRKYLERLRDEHSIYIPMQKEQSQRYLDFSKLLLGN